MAYLIDTHVFLWYIDGSPNLSERAKTLIDSTYEGKYLSVASLWGIAIKQSLNKLSLTKPFDKLLHFATVNNISLLPIEFDQLLQLKNLPLHHKDPFDRLIIAQAITENLSIISADRHFKAYPLNVIW